MQARYRHTNIIAKDWRRLVEFYVQVFGCVPHPPERPTTKANREGFGHIAFEVEDVRSAYEEVLEAGGRQMAQVVEQEVPGVGLLTVVYVEDPEGNIVELQSWD